MTAYTRTNRVITWGQNPQRPGATFGDETEARRWCEAEAPLSCGWAFLQRITRGKRGTILLYRAETKRWSDDLSAGAHAEGPMS